MTITPFNIIAHELIGLRVRVSSSTDPTKIGMAGVVRNETRNTLTVQIRERLLCIPKTGSSLTFEIPNSESVTIEGSSLNFRPEDRIKRRIIQW